MHRPPLQIPSPEKLESSGRAAGATVRSEMASGVTPWRRFVTTPGLAACLLLAGGVTLRLTQYGLMRGYWGDEAFVLFNAGTLPIRQLMTGPLNAVPASQSAPAAFMCVLRVLMETGGKAEWLMRLLPLVAGVLALGVVFKCAVRWLEPAGALAAVGLLSASASCVFQSATVKPYSLDLLAGALAVAVGWWGVAAGTTDRQAGRAVGLLGCLGAVAGWWSFGGLFAFWGTAAAVTVMRPALLSHGWAWAGGAALGVAGGVLVWWINLRHQSSPDLQEYWRQAFAPWHESVQGGKPWLLPVWVGRTFCGLVAMVQGPCGWVLIPVVFYGMWKRSAVVWVAIAPLLAVLFGGLVGAYPARASRVTLVVVPGVALACGAVVAGLKGSPGLRTTFLYACCGAGLWGVWECAQEFVSPHNERDTAPAVRHVISNWQAGDRMAAVLGTGAEVWCYVPAVGPVAEGAGRTDPWPVPLTTARPTTVAVTRGAGDAVGYDGQWWVFSYARDKRAAALANAEAMAGAGLDRQRSWIGPMSAAFYVRPRTTGAAK